MEKKEILSEDTSMTFKSSHQLCKRNEDIANKAKEFRTTLKFKDLKKFVEKFEASVDEDTPVFIYQLPDKLLFDAYLNDTLLFVPEYIPEGMHDEYIKSATKNLSDGMLDVYLKGSDIIYTNETITIEL